jgi:hypothetical protein
MRKKIHIFVLYFLSCTENIILNISSVLCLAPLYGRIEAEVLFYGTFGNPFLPFCLLYSFNVGTAVAQWLRYCATNRKVAGSIPDRVIGFLH